MEQTVDYVIRFNGFCDNGSMHGRYELENGDGRSIIRDCRFGPGTAEQATYLTLVVGLGDLLVRVQKAGKDPFNHIIGLGNELPEPSDDIKAGKLHVRAAGMLRRFGEYLILDETAVMV
jgi:hypothetical protein